MNSIFIFLNLFFFVFDKNRIKLIFDCLNFKQHVLFMEKYYDYDSVRIEKCVIKCFLYYIHSSKLDPRKSTRNRYGYTIIRGLLQEIKWDKIVC